MARGQPLQRLLLVFYRIFAGILHAFFVLIHQPEFFFVNLFFRLAGLGVGTVDLFFAPHAPISVATKTEWAQAAEVELTFISPKGCPNCQARLLKGWLPGWADETVTTRMGRNTFAYQTGTVNRVNRGQG